MSKEALEVIDAPENSINLVYEQPAFAKRCFANFLDIIFFFLAFVGIFIGAQKSSEATPQYRYLDSVVANYRRDSKLFRYSSARKTWENISTWLDNNGDTSFDFRVYQCEETIEDFLSYIQDNCPTADYERVQKDYDDSRLSDKTKSSSGEQLFVEIQSLTVANSISKIDSIPVPTVADFGDKTELTLFANNETYYKTTGYIIELGAWSEESKYADVFIGDSIDTPKVNSLYIQVSEKSIYDGLQAQKQFYSISKLAAVYEKASDDSIILKAKKIDQKIKYGLVDTAHIKIGKTIIQNPDTKKVKANQQYYYEHFYREYTLVNCGGFMLTLFPEYRVAMQSLSNILFFIQLPVTVVFAGFLIYLLPSLIFKRGRCTFGKKLMQIGVVDSNVLNPTFPRTLARWAIFFFGVFVLGFFTFGITFIISFSMMAFTKKRQSFPDYMLGLTEVDTNKQKIYYNKYEISLEFATDHKDPISFEMARDE